MVKKDEQKAQEDKKVPAGQRTGQEPKKRGTSKAGVGPDHTRAPGKGFRTTALTFEEIRKEAEDEAKSEDYSRTEARATSFGPNRSETLYKPRKDESFLDTQRRVSHEQACATANSGPVEEELAEAGATLEESPERYNPHSDKYKGAGQAPDPVEAARLEADKDALTADKNYGNAHLSGNLETQRGLRG